MLVAQSSRTSCRRRTDSGHTGSSAMTARSGRARREHRRPLGFLVEASLEVLGDDGSFGLVALVDERQPECQRRVVEDLDVLAQVITVRGDISVDRSPSRKPLRVRFATATIDAISDRPTDGTRADTISISCSAGR